MNRFFVYILSNYERTILYIGVTDDLARRLSEHRAGLGSRFAGKYNAKYLIRWEEFPDSYHAICREKQLKNWRRDWKLKLIQSVNPEMRDLSGELPI
jgi:putative endonuclease